MSNTLTVAELDSHVGKLMGESDWVLISQAMIQQFADATGDHQFIHVDEEKAATTPFGGTIAHGLLTLSLLPKLAEGIIPRLEGQTMGVNYGFNKVRFTYPVPSNSRIKAQFTLTNVQQRGANQYQLQHEVSVFIENQEKPALVADWLSLAVL